MTLIDKKYGSDNEEPRLNEDQILNALKASNRIDSHLATNMAKLNKNFSEHKRAMGDSHQQVEDVIVDQATRVMNHLTEESKRQNKEALEEYFKTPNFFVDLLNKVVEAVEQNSRKIDENSKIVKNRMSYGQYLEEIPEIDLPKEDFDLIEENGEREESKEDDFGF
tara:strand:+ start:150 stop:647 length:498 start_codon:yes stop_codon:yes gene_type:complete